MHLNSVGSVHLALVLALPCLGSKQGGSAAVAKRDGGHLAPEEPSTSSLRTAFGRRRELKKKLSNASSAVATQ